MSFDQPHPQHGPPPSPQPGWGYPAPASYPLGQPPPGYPSNTVVSPGNSTSTPGRSRLLVASIILSSAALVGVLGIVIWLIAVGAPGAGGGGPLTSSVNVPAGGRLLGDDLAASLQQRIRADGGDPTRTTCPDTARVDQNVTTVCHGSIDGEDWALVVFFEDTAGSYTLQPV